MDRLKFVTPTKEYEEQAFEFINEFYEYSSQINGVGGLNRYLNDYDGWLLKLEDDRTRVQSEEKVPALTFFLVREHDNKIVGIINIRLALIERLRKFGGHIGYSIRPTERRKGYNKINLYLALLICQKHGIKEVLMGCGKDNLGSAKTIKALGGILLREFYEDVDVHQMVQVYAIDVDKSIEENRKIYESYLS